MSTTPSGPCFARLEPAPRTDSVPIHLVEAEAFTRFREALPPEAQTWLGAIGFEPAAGKAALLPGKGGELAGVLLCVGAGSAADPLIAGKLPELLPPGAYHFAGAIADPHLATLAVLLGSYRFSRYMAEESSHGEIVLAVPEGAEIGLVETLADAITIARDLINTPASDLGPQAMSDAARSVAETGGADCRQIVGQELLDHDFAMIHAVGRAAAEAPRLVDFTWGDESHPKVTLVGKSVCFDTGGLNLKPDASMLLMKKDMGGGAIVLGLAKAIMRLKLPVRLRVLLPIVENSVSAQSFRPGDVLRSRAGLSVEIGNTDAEGRLILADALALADEEAPDLLIDVATLTGAARVALGPDLPPFFTDDEALATSIAEAATRTADPAWRLPLWAAYDQMLKSKVADLNHIGGGPFAGSIVAALFLRRFVRQAKSWVHFDAYAWTPSAKPGRPEGGEGQLIRLLHALLAERYGQR